MTIYDLIIEAQKNILAKPRTCEICGAKETLDNIMLKYDNGMIMCDDCMINYYNEELNERKDS